ncbi:MAG: flagellar hook-basal body protein [Candidatus Melainabacteria bacterium]|nr:flagellar hook-basal body protein [Candidatus Melainabacteria bacterium]
MLRGIYTSATGMEAQKDQQSLIADNLANSNTSGFKAVRHIYQSFDTHPLMNSVTGQNMGEISHGIETYSTSYDFSQGALRQTGNPLDIGIQGTGFFAVQDINGNVGYTRNGHFTLDREGYIVTQAGDYLLDQGQAPIFLGFQGVRDFTVLRNGNLVVNGDYVARLNTFEFPEDAKIVRQAGDKYTTELGAALLSSTNSTLVQGFVENSNVSPVKTSAQMVQVMRGYEANQRALRAQTDTLQLLMQLGQNI